MFLVLKSEPLQPDYVVMATATGAECSGTLHNLFKKNILLFAQQGMRSRVILGLGQV